MSAARYFLLIFFIAFIGYHILLWITDKITALGKSVTPTLKKKKRGK